MATVKGRLKSTGDLLVIGEIDETSDVLSFDGVDDSVRTQDKLPINGSSATIEQWIKILGRGDRSWNILIELQDGSGGSRKGLYWDEDDYIYGAFENNGSGYAVLSGSDPVHNEWQHWACVIDDSNSELRFYVDGKLEATDSNSGSWDDLHCSIARRYDKDDMANIVVSDARIWNIARTQTEIQDNMNKRLTGNEPGLVAYYPLDEGTGTIAYDLVGNNDGVINGATWTTGGVPIGGNFRLDSSGNIKNVLLDESQSNALSFDGVGDYVGFPTNFGIFNGSQDITYLTWAKPTSRPASGSNEEYTIINPLAEGYIVLRFEYNGFVFGIYDHTNGFQVIRKSYEQSDLGWHYLAGVFRSSGLSEFFVDCNKIGEMDLSGYNPYTSGSVNYIGGDKWGRYFHGDISNISIWNTAHTQTEIQDNMHKHLTGNELGLVAYYPLNEGTGTNAYDLVGNNDGTINGATWVNKNPSIPMRHKNGELLLNGELEENTTL